MTKEKPAKENKNTDRYTATEVGVLLESMDKKIDQVLDGHVGLDERMEKLEIVVEKNNQRLDKVEISLHGNNRRLDSVEFNFVALNGRFDRLEDAVSKLSKDVGETREELGETRSEMGGMRKSLENKIDGLSARMSAVEASR